MCGYETKGEWLVFSSSTSMSERNMASERQQFLRSFFLLYRFFFSPFFSLFINGRRETRKTSFLFLLVRHVQSERKKRGEKGNEREKKKEILSLFSLCSPHQSETTRNPLKKETRPVTYDTYRSSTNAMDFSCSVLFFCCASFMHACLHVIVIDDREYTPDS